MSVADPTFRPPERIVVACSEVRESSSRGSLSAPSCGVIVRAFTRFSFPHYWYYDVLRALDCWRGHPWDERLAEAVDLVRSK